MKPEANVIPIRSTVASVNDNDVGPHYYVVDANLNKVYDLIRTGNIRHDNVSTPRSIEHFLGLLHDGKFMYLIHPYLVVETKRLFAILHITNVFRRPN